MRGIIPEENYNTKWFGIRITALAVLFIALNVAAGNFYFIVNAGLYPKVHTIIELVSIITAMSVSVLSWYVHRYMGDLRSLVLSVVFCAVGMLDTAHFLSYIGMPDFIGENSVNKASTYWIMARITQSAGILAAVCAGSRPYRGSRSGLGLAALLPLMTALIYYTAVNLDRLPSMYDAVSRAQTSFKIGLEYTVIAIMVVSASIILCKRKKNRGDFLLFSAIFTGILAEIDFTLYSHAYDAYNLLGHVYKIISFLFILKALVDEGLAEIYRSFKALEEKSRELARLNDQLQTADRLKNDFLANTNHELRTPLSSIVAFTEMLLDERCSGSLNELQRDYLKEISDSSRDLLGKIKDLLVLSGLMGGKTVIWQERFLLAEAVAIAVSARQDDFDEKGIRLETEFEKDIYIYADREKVGRILANLLDNAIKFTGTGGIIKISGSADLSSGMARISVSDTGVGIEPGHRDYVFDMFYQADGTSTRKYGGTGIGLTLASKLAELNGGRIDLESEYGRGSIFTLLLPLSEEA